MKQKITDIPSYEKFINPEDLANAFNVYTDQDLGEPYKAYNINKTVVLKGLDDLPLNSFEYYQVQNHDTWNLISYKIYGTIQLWWLILKANKITNAMIEPKAGWVLKILPKSTVSDILVQMKKG